MAFDFPLLLYLAPAAALAVTGLAWWGRARRIHHARRWSGSLAAQAAQFGRRGPLLIAVAVVAAMTALAGPRWGTREVETEAKGLNLVLALDISRSMLAEDVTPSRLERAKREARRLIHDLEGDRIGLLSFAGQGFVLSPLTVDGSALHLLVEALHPDMTTAGGSEFTSAISRSHDLLMAGDEVADRVLVLFTDGEAHDSLPSIMAAAERLRRSGVHLILVAEGGLEPARIPVRDPEGNFVGYQRDPGEQVVLTRRRDDILSAIADAGHGVLVAADVNDQAGVVRDMIAAFKRAPTARTTAAQDVARAWIPLLAAVLSLLLHAVTRRSAALASLALCVSTAAVHAQSPQNLADRAWTDGNYERAARLYLEQADRGAGGDTVLFNLGTAALAARDTGTARTALEAAARSLEPEVRFRARFNLGLLELRLADWDREREMEHLSEARRHYREALLLKPGDAGSKRNLELAVVRMPPPQSEDLTGPPSGGDTAADSPPAEGLTVAQAVQILNSIGEEERRIRQKLNRNRAQTRETRGRRDW